MEWLPDSGAIVFEDAKTRSKVTLQTSEINEVSRSDFEAGRRKENLPAMLRQAEISAAGIGAFALSA
jgi:hypothetical protein